MANALAAEDIVVSGVSPEVAAAIQAALLAATVPTIHTEVVAANDYNDAVVAEVPREQTELDRTEEIVRSVLRGSIESPVASSTNIEAKVKKPVAKKAAETPPAASATKEADSLVFTDQKYGIAGYLDPEFYSKKPDNWEAILEKELLPTSLTIESGAVIDLFIVGCGGTGSRLINLLAQFAASNRRNRVNLTLIDPDTVEPKNLSRQMFYEFEVGQNKAEALADRFGMLYGITINSNPGKIDADCGLRFSNYGFIFDCTDNVEARKTIHNLYVNLMRGGYNNIFTVSCGNQKDFGQVVVGGLRSNSANFAINPAVLGINQYTPIFTAYDNIMRAIDNGHYAGQGKVSAINYLPSMMSYYSDMKDTESVSCADMEIVEEQSMAINSTIAQLAFNMFFTLITRGGNLKAPIVWANLDNDYSSMKVNTYGKLLEYYARTIYGRNLYGQNLEKAMLFLYNMGEFKINCSVVEANKPLIQTIEQSFGRTIPGISYYSYNKANTFPFLVSWEEYVDSILAREDSWVFLPLFPFIHHVIQNRAFRYCSRATNLSSYIKIFNRTLCTKIESHYAAIQGKTNFRFLRD